MGQAQDRVRLILDRSDSPWIPDADITNFIDSSINEFVGERVNLFPSNQELRDDLGRFIQTAVYSVPILDSGVLTAQADTWMLLTEELYSDDGNWGQLTQNAEISSPVKYSNTGVSFNSMMLFAGDGVSTLGTSLTQENSFAQIDNANTVYATPNVRVVLSLRVESDLDPSYPKEIDIRSIDKFVKIKDDPFNSANEDNYVAVKTGNVYWVSPDVRNTFIQEIGGVDTTESKTVVMTYISGGSILEDEIMWLPSHAREEVCQIAARKILATLADERYESSGIEVKQLKGK